MSIPPHFHTERAAWDTGAQFTIVSPRIIEALHLNPLRQGSVMGIGGDKISSTYMVHIALPNGKIIKDVEVYSTDIDDYDLLIGMDIIVVTTAKTDEEARELLRLFNMPFAR